MTTLTSSDTRPRTNDGVFQIRVGNDPLAIFQAAEAWSIKNGVGAWVQFMPGVFDIWFSFEFFHIARIIGCGIGSTRLRRHLSATIFKSVWDFPMQDHSPVIGGFEIENMVETSEPAIEI